MGFLIFGLIVFLGTHSLRVGGDARRSAWLLRWGETRYKAAYTFFSVFGLGMVVYGFGLARETPVVLWTPSVGARHVAFALMLVSMVLLAAAYVPGNLIRSKLHHPMVLSVKVWALAHLLANGMLAHVVLFGGFLVWSVVVFKASRQRDKTQNVVYAQGNVRFTVIALAFGLFLWAALLGWLHGALIGVRLVS